MLIVIALATSVNNPPLHATDSFPDPGLLRFHVARHVFATCCMLCAFQETFSSLIYLVLEHIKSVTLLIHMGTSRRLMKEGLEDPEPLWQWQARLGLDLAQEFSNR